MTETNELLNERGKRYGTFKRHARVSQALKRSIVEHIDEQQKVLEPYQAEALEMICHKIARIVNGDPNYIDSWADIAGYATLVVKTLQGEEI